MVAVMCSLHQLLSEPPGRLRVSVTLHGISVRHPKDREHVFVLPAMAAFFSIPLWGWAVVGFGALGWLIPLLLVVLTLWWVTIDEVVLTQHELGTRRVWLRQHRHVQRVPLSTISGLECEQVVRAKPREGGPGVFRLRTAHHDDTPPLRLGLGWSEEERAWLSAVVTQASQAAGEGTSSAIPQSLAALTSPHQGRLHRLMDRIRVRGGRDR